MINETPIENYNLKPSLVISLVPPIAFFSNVDSPPKYPSGSFGRIGVTDSYCLRNQDRTLTFDRRYSTRVFLRSPSPK